MDSEGLAQRLNAVASPQRLRILAALADGPLHVSALARRLGMSRPLLYVHLTRLEEQSYVSGRLELSEDGKALKIFSVEPFTITVDLAVVTDAVAHDPLPEEFNDA